jgi:protein-tyrosine kinase
MSGMEGAERQLGQRRQSLMERAAAHLSSLERSTALGSEAAGTARVHTGGPPRETGRRIEIDFERLRKMGFALPGDQSPMAEEFRLIKRPLLTAAHAPRAPSSSRNSNVLLITSAHPNEGKTFVATNLAFSIASEHDFHVVLIDADFPNPAIPNLLDFERGPGLVEVVSGAVDLLDVMIGTNIENLTLLSSGQAHPVSSELLASGRMARFVDEISARYPDRIVIFDTPPVLVRSDAIALAKHVGQVVLVMEAERTSRAALDEAIELIGAERIGGVVLNKAPALAREHFGRFYGRYGR